MAAIQTRDVIFKFDNACNSWCCRWCCWKVQLEDEDPVYVTPRGQVRKFDFSKPGATQNALRALRNIQSRLEAVAQDQAKIRVIVQELQEKVGISPPPQESRVISLVQIRRIEEIAVPILRAPSPPPEPMALVRSQKSRDLAGDLHSEAEWEEVQDIQ